MKSRLFTGVPGRSKLKCVLARWLTASVCLAVSATVQAQWPVGLPELTYPKDNPSSEAKIALGRMLYFDKRLSADDTVSCASCHDPKYGWSNNDATAVGVGGQRGGRSAPTIINSAYQKFQFWDGRAGSLEEQALGPIANPIEMNLPIEEAVKKLSAIEGYQKRFQEVFGSGVSADNLAKALAAFERTIVSGNAPYDRFKAGDTKALSPEAQAGMKLFFGKANCSACHNGPHFSDGAFHNLGVASSGAEADQGRRKISGIEGDHGAFRTPTLREIARTAPYMHDGSLKTLEEVVDYYDKGGTPNDYLDEEIYPLKLSPQDKKALVTFLKEGLASPDYPDVATPELP
ncbi:MAG: cytochrome-c peroxidase [Aureliella sp.]|jgi:cytochrome c peroxidase